jgi:hypothetical protein
MPYSHRRSPEKRKERRERFKSFEQRKKEADTIRGIVKDLNQRDLLTGEIIYSKENEKSVKAALAAGTFACEDWRGDKQQVPLSSNLISKIVAYEYGEVLNRAIEPCWWLSNV